MLPGSAPAAGTRALLEKIWNEDQRVMTIAHRLATRGTALCPEGQAPLSGLRVHVRGQYARSVQAEAQRLFGLGDFPVVLAIAPDGPAHRAGLRRGDEIVSINDHDMRVLPRSADYAAVERVDAAVESALSIGELRIVVRRGGRIQTMAFAGERGCASRVELVPGRKLNASADGRTVQITTAVLSEAGDDAELAFILAHEMAHNILKHAERLDRTGRRAGTIRETEIEADRLGLRLMHAAGYDIEAAARFWSRFGRKTGAGIFSDGTHMRTKARVRFLQDEATAIRRAAQ
jgi:beta-barrel assembly-enhancing protease